MVTGYRKWSLRFGKEYDANESSCTVNAPSLLAAKAVLYVAG
jgi:hypothetical protein